MKIEVRENDDYVIFLNKDYLGGIDLSNKNMVEPYFKNLFLFMKKYFIPDINGYYDVIIYQDKSYGFVVELYKLDMDFFDISDDKIDMKITFKLDDEFLYEIEDIFFIESLLDKFIIYRYNDKYYLRSSELSEKMKLILCEGSKIIYGSTANNIIKNKNLIL